MRDDDRTVHASEANGWELVRYNRAGKWYFEHPAERRQHVKLPDAVSRVAGTTDWTIHFGRSGGSTFDHRVLQADHTVSQAGTR